MVNRPASAGCTGLGYRCMQSGLQHRTTANCSDAHNYACILATLLNCSIPSAAVAACGCPARAADVALHSRGAEVDSTAADVRVVSALCCAPGEAVGRGQRLALDDGSKADGLRRRPARWRNEIHKGRLTPRLPCCARLYMSSAWLAPDASDEENSEKGRALSLSLSHPTPQTSPVHPLKHFPHLLALWSPTRPRGPVLRYGS